RTALAGELAAWPGPIVAFESPRRLPASLAVLAAAMPERRAAVCRELTKRFEEVVRGTLAELAERFAEPPRGEITLVLGGAAGLARPAAFSSPDDARRAVDELVEAGVRRRQAADVVARLTGLSRNALYRDSL
ncbi:MAG TPA: SAM-dependent methyltransferase, partial [Planctomycetota bacterium]|nr:SAM-dependent methyltransferase [Planctomycetota bacterium]